MIRKKLLIWFLSISLIPLLIFGVFIYLQTRAILLDHTRDEMTALANIQKAQMERIIEMDQSRLKLFSSRVLLKDRLSRYLATRNPVYQEKLNELLTDTLSSIKDFKIICLLDPKGNIVASTEKGLRGVKLGVDESFKKAMREEYVDVVLDGKGIIRDRLAGPIFQGKDLLGVVIIDTDVSNFLSAMTDYTGLGRTGEMLFAKRDKEGNALYLHPLRFDRGAALRRMIPKAQTSVPIIQALLKKESFFESRDYRGSKVWAVTRYLKGPDWGLVVKMDESEVLAPIGNVVNILIVAGGLLAGLVIFLALRLSRTISEPIQKLHKGTEIIGGGNLDYKVGIPTRDEIGQLSRSFDKMTENLKNTLASRAEFKAISEAALGRELKMIELEKEVNGLLKEMGREPKYK